jgi:hypothetical protein
MFRAYGSEYSFKLKGEGIPGGELKVETKDNEGSKFTVQLPV